MRWVRLLHRKWREVQSANYTNGSCLYTQLYKTDALGGDAWCSGSPSTTTPPLPLLFSSLTYFLWSTIKSKWFFWYKQCIFLLLHFPKEATYWFLIGLPLITVKQTSQIQISSTTVLEHQTCTQIQSDDKNFGPPCQFILKKKRWKKKKKKSRNFKDKPDSFFCFSVLSFSFFLRLWTISCFNLCDSLRNSSLKIHRLKIKYTMHMGAGQLYSWCHKKAWGKPTNLSKYD